MNYWHKLFYFVSRLVGRMTWIRWGLRYKLFTLLKPVSSEFTTTFYGRTYRGNLDNFIDRVVYIFGAHERQVMEYAGLLISNDSIVLDVGANIGHHALFFSTKAKEVHAFEPNTAFRKHFDALMKENDVTNVQFHAFGLGDATHDAPYFAPTGDNQGIGSFVEDYDPTNKSVGTMRVVQGDEAVASLQLSRIDFVKIDVEGYEESVLRGLQETLRTFKPIIIMEYTPGDFSSEESFRTLTRGYTPYILRANEAVLFFFNNPSCHKKEFNFARSHGEVLLVPEK